MVILELAAKDGSGDNAVHHVEAVADNKTVADSKTVVESENKVISSVRIDKATPVVQSDKSATSSSPSDKAIPAVIVENKDLTPNRTVLSAPQLLPLLEQVNHISRKLTDE